MDTNFFIHSPHPITSCSVERVRALSFAYRLMLLITLLVVIVCCSFCFFISETVNDVTATSLRVACVIFGDNSVWNSLHDNLLIEAVSIKCVT